MFKQILPYGIILNVENSEENMHVDIIICIYFEGARHKSPRVCPRYEAGIHGSYVT